MIEEWNCCGVLFSAMIYVMSNEKHVRALEQGVKRWNRWRQRNPRLRPDLSGLELRPSMGKATSMFDPRIHKEYTPAPDLSGIDFSRTNLSNTRLSGVQLKKADLREAVLIGACLKGCKLQGADLGSSKLMLTLFITCDLTGANLAEAELYESTFARAVLKSARGLDDCMHKAESSIDQHTILASWPLSVPFLQACGLRIEIIDSFRQIAEDRKRGGSCFLSHSTEDLEFVERIYADLRKKHLRCFYARRDMVTGDTILDRLRESIHLRDRMLLILSKASLQSTWVAREVEEALSQENRLGRVILVPIKIDDAIDQWTEGWPLSVRKTRHIADFTRWKRQDEYEKALGRLWRNLIPKPSQDDLKDRVSELGRELIAKVREKKP